MMSKNNQTKKKTVRCWYVRFSRSIFLRQTNRRRQMCKDIFLHRSIAVQLTITSAAVVYRSDFYSVHRVHPNTVLYGI